MRRQIGAIYEFGEQSWADIASFLGGMSDQHPQFSYLVEIVDSIITTGLDKQLAGSTSMHDLLVVPRPASAQVHELIAVRAPGSMRPGPPGMVRIEHLSSTGHDECVDRPPADAVPLFWRFAIEKYGIHPPDRPT